LHFLLSTFSYQLSGRFGPARLQLVIKTVYGWKLVEAFFIEISSSFKLNTKRGFTSQRHKGAEKKKWDEF